MKLREKAYDELKETLEYLQKWEEISKVTNTVNISLLAGLTGTIVVLIDSYRVFPELVSKKTIENYITKLEGILSEADVLFTGYCSGIAGLAFFFLKLKEQNEFYRSEFDEIIEEIDEILLEQLSVDIKNGNFDILHGAVGIGLYFLERRKSAQVNRIIDVLGENATQTQDGQVFWHRSDSYSSKGEIYDFGLAHGNVSYLYFLAKCKFRGIQHHNVDFLITGVINFYKANVQELSEKIYSYYPSTQLKSNFDLSLHKPLNSRLGWCYGDLGVFHTLYITSELIQDNELRRNCLDKLQTVSCRKKEHENEMIEGDFCHGSAGISFMFKNLYQKTGEKQFLQANELWVNETLKEKNRAINSILPTHGYNFPIYNNTAQNNSLLEGLSGVTASYLKFLTEKRLMLDEIFFLSFN